MFLGHPGQGGQQFADVLGVALGAALHQGQQAVEAGQELVDDPGVRGQLAAADHVQEIFQAVGQFADIGQV